MENTMIADKVTPIKFIGGVLNRSQKKRKNRVQIVLDEHDYTRLSALESRVDPHTKTEVIATALQILEGIIDTYDSGYTIYKSKDGGNTVEPIEILK